MIDKYIQNIEHIGLPSENIDYAIEFYSNIGFKLINTEYVAAKGQRVAFMQIGETQLEIYEEESGFHGCGSINHIALGVHDVDRLFEEAKANGLNIIEQIQELPFWKNGIRFFKVEGPDSVVLEFCEKL